MIELGWELLLTLAGILGSLVLFFNKLSTDLKRLEERISETRISLSDEHKRHDDNLSKELLSMIRALEKHISSEEIEGALQAKSREEIVEIRKILNNIQCKITEK